MEMTSNRKALSVLTGAALLLSACATTPGDLPTVHYAAAASNGEITTALAGRPSQEQIAIAEDKWSRAVADSYACGLPKKQVFEAGLVGALELATMTSLSRGGGKAERAQAVASYAMKSATLAFSSGPRPKPERCADLGRWLPEVRAQGKAAIQRAKDNGYLDNIKI